MQFDFPKIKFATPLRIEAAKARLKLGEAELITVGDFSTEDEECVWQCIQDKDGVVFL